jgi:hypothetical protein
VINWLDSIGLYPLFSEGWALYAENPLIALESDAYENNPLQKYGMLKWQIWRALRLIVDTGLHYKGNLESRSRKNSTTNRPVFVVRKLNANVYNRPQLSVVLVCARNSRFIVTVYCILARATNN